MGTDGAAGEDEEMEDAGGGVWGTADQENVMVFRVSMSLRHWVSALTPVS